jgi:alpha,alpha-trehalase
MTDYLLKTEIVGQVKAYITNTWQTLRRSHQHLLEALFDPKLPNHGRDPRKVLYISRKENSEQIRSILQQSLSANQLQQFHIRHIPSNPLKIKQHGLLYLPYDYVVPGGRFNEMYGWDSFYIVLGLLEDGETALAKNMVDNMLYQVTHYGKVLNANRSYQLDRSQPPVLTQMVLAVYQKIQDQHWLEEAIEPCCNYYDFWTSKAHLIPDIGLSRYYAKSITPAPESVYGELDHLGNNHYQRTAEYYKRHKIQAYDVNRFYNRAKHALRPLFFKADRSGRESGFDPSSRYGPLNADIIHHAPVCLNTLLYQMELDLAIMNDFLGKEAHVEKWREKAAVRAELINYYCWDEDLGYYFDYNFITCRARPYIFATTFYPLWAGLATPEHAQRVVHNLPALEAPGGLLTSAYVTGNQWDAPLGWAPLHFFAVHGLRRYGYKQEACRLAHKFVTLINDEFEKYQCIYEKYDVSRRSARVQHILKFGYESNEPGFGWTNAVYLNMLRVLREEGG